MSILCAIFQVYYLILIVRIVLSWFPVRPGTGLATAASIIHDITEPVLGPLRRVIPPVGGGGFALDLSPIVAFFALVILQRSFC